MPNDTFDALAWAVPQLPYDFGGQGLFLNAVSHPDLPRNLVCYQPRRDVFNELVEEKRPCLEAVEGSYDFAWVLGTGSEPETLGYLGLACRHLKPGAPFVMSVANDDGGGRYTKRFKLPHSMSKHKCRILAGDAVQPPPEDWALGSEMTQGAHGFWTQPGIFGWNKLDAGSQLLIDLMPEKLAGAGADFGCGWGLLSLSLAGRGCAQWHLYDIDRRAVEAARRNLAQADLGRVQTEVFWQDLTRETPRRTYDVIALNPPFHRDGRVSFEVGCELVDVALTNLRKGGELWLVANQHLPYEVLLKERLGAIELVGQRGGFKVLRALKARPAGAPVPRGRR